MVVPGSHGAVTPSHAVGDSSAVAFVAVLPGLAPSILPSARDALRRGIILGATRKFPDDARTDFIILSIVTIWRSRAIGIQ